MSVVIETTVGDLTVDLYLEERPRACLNFLKLCKIKYYNYNLFHTISRGFIAQTGDPTGSRTGGESIFGILEGAEKRYFEGENKPRIKHTRMGLISFVGNGERMIGSQFFITLGEELTYLDDKHCVFGEVVEGHDVLDVINEVICDTDDRPYQDVRITHTVVLDDPYPDPKRLRAPSRSPSPSAERLQGGRIAPDEEIDDAEGKSAQEIYEMRAEREAKARATILEMIGDIPDAEIAPPENVLFVCKLNPVTTDEDLEIIFNRFGKIKSCEVIRDRKTGDSLQYAFIEFEEKKSCEDAYLKMDNILIDDRRIHVDFSQSVSKVKWLGKGRGVAHFDNRGRQVKEGDSNIGKGNYKIKGRGTRNHTNGRYGSPPNDRKHDSRVSKDSRRGSRSKSPTADNYRTSSYKIRQGSPSRSRGNSKSFERYDRTKRDEKFRETGERRQNNTRNRRSVENQSRSPSRGKYASVTRKETYTEYHKSKQRSRSRSKSISKKVGNRKQGSKSSNKFISRTPDDDKRNKRSRSKSRSEAKRESSGHSRRESYTRDNKFKSSSKYNPESGKKEDTKATIEKRKGRKSSSSESDTDSENKNSKKKKMKKLKRHESSSSSDSSDSFKTKEGKRKEKKKYKPSSTSTFESEDTVRKKKRWNTKKRYKSSSNASSTSEDDTRKKRKYSTDESDTGEKKKKKKSYQNSSKRKTKKR